MLVYNPALGKRASTADQYHYYTTNKRLRKIDEEPTLESTNRLACASCEKTFCKRSALNRHMQASHAQGKPFFCNIPGCGQTFTRRDSLNRHKLGHEKAGFVRCPGCNYAMRKDYLKAHLDAQQNGWCRDAYLSATPSSNDSVVSGQSPVAHPASPYSDVPHSPVDSVTSPRTEQVGRFDFVQRRLSGVWPLTRRSSMQSVDESDDSMDQSTPTPGSPGSSVSPLENRRLSELRGEDARTPRIIADVDPRACPTMIPDPIFYQQEEDDEDIEEPPPTTPEDRGEEAARLQDLWRRSLESPDNGTSITKQLGRHIQQRQNGSGRRRPSTMTHCDICELEFGNDQQLVIDHARSHWIRPPPKQYTCDVCEIGFVYQHDLKFHQQHQAECFSLRTPDSDASNVWITNVFDNTRDQYLADLKTWEKYQLYQYLSDMAILAKYLTIADDRTVRTMQHRRNSRWSTISLSSFKSTFSRINYSDKLDIAALTSDFRDLSMRRSEGPDDDDMSVVSATGSWTASRAFGRRGSVFA